MCWDIDTNAKRADRLGDVGGSLDSEDNGRSLFLKYVQNLSCASLDTLFKASI